MDEKGVGRKILFFPLTKIIVGTVVVVGIYGTTQYYLSELLKLSPIAEDQRNMKKEKSLSYRLKELLNI